MKMAVSNFIPQIWSRKIQKSLELKTKLVDYCNRDYEGDVKFAGSVKILGVGDPKIAGYNGEVDYEEMNDLGQILNIDFRDYFAFKVDDINKAQSVPGLPEKYQQKASDRLAQRRDVNIGRLIAGKCVSTKTELTSTYAKTSDKALAHAKDYFVLNDSNKYERVDKPNVDNIGDYYEITNPTYETGATNVTTATAKTQDEVKEAIDGGFVALNVRNCDFGIRAEIDPETYMTFKNNLVEISTNNPEMIRKGIVGRYNNADFVMTNAICNDGSYKWCMLRTKNAIAFAGQIKEVESMRLEKSFADGVRGLDVYGLKIIAQDELQAIKIPA